VSALRVLCTKPDGGVFIITPFDTCLDELRLGIVEARAQRGFDQDELDRAYEAGKFLRDAAWRPDFDEKRRRTLAHTWIECLNAGGLSEREAMELIRDLSAPAFSLAWEIVDVSEIPGDRTHRDAWKRSHNGGPIWIDEAKAAAIDLDRAVKRELAAAEARRAARVRRRLLKAH